MKSTYLKTILSISFLLCILSFANASQVSYLKYMTRGKMESFYLANPTNTVIVLQDPLFDEPQGNTQTPDYQIRRDVYVHLIYGREELSDVAGNFFKYKVSYDLTSDQDPAFSESGTLVIEFNEISGVYEAVGKHLNLPSHVNEVQLQVTSICGDFTGDGNYDEQCLGNGVNDLGINADDIRLELEMLVEKTYFFDSATEVPEIDHEPNYAINEVSEINLYWSFIPGFEDYELEYVYWDALATDKPSTNDVDYEEKLFENSIRITTWRNEFQLDATYPEGELFFRVRAVGRFIHDVGTDYSIKKYGQWSEIKRQSLVPYTSFEPFEKDKNWQFTTTFAEEGKNKTVLSFHDGSLRSRQLLTNLSDEEITLVAETDYSIEGQGVMSILPTPALTKNFGNNFFFKPAFNRNLEGEAYSYLDFDREEGAAPLHTGFGAGAYFSPNNNFGDLHRNYIADALGFPLTQARYLRDATGRMAAQGGVGDFYQLGSGRDTRYYYINAKSTELRRLFGSNVGNAKHYKKNIIVDPNGQISVSYIDQTGQVIATALMGDPPANVDSIDTSGLVPIVNDLMGSNQKDLFLSRSVNSIFNARETTYNFTYEMEGVYNQFGTYCESCEYEVHIRILDEDGVLVHEEQVAIEAPDDEDCIGGQTYPGATIEFSHTLYEIGEYEVIKELRMTGGAIDIANYQVHLEDLLPDFQEYLDEALANIDTTHCQWSCYDLCEDKAKMEHGEWFDNTTGELLPQFETEFNQYIETCTFEDCIPMTGEDVVTEVALGECESSLEQMKFQISPGGFSFPPNAETGAYSATSVAALRDELEGLLFYVKDQNGLVYTIINNEISPPLGFPDELIVLNNSTGESYEVSDWGDFFDNVLSDEDYWQEDWANTLVEAHREWCIYQDCLALNDGFDGNGNPIEDSYDYNLELALADTWLDMDGTYTWGVDLVTSIAVNDPFVNSVWCMGSPRDYGYAIDGALSSFGNNNEPIIDVIDDIVSEASNNPNSPYYNATGEELDQLRWQLFRGAYLSEKEKAIWACYCGGNRPTEDEYSVFTYVDPYSLQGSAGEWQDEYCEESCAGQIEHWVQQINNYLYEHCLQVQLSVEDENTIRYLLSDNFCFFYCAELQDGAADFIVEVTEEQIAAGELQSVQNILNNYCSVDIGDILIPEVSVYSSWQIIDPCIYTILEAVDEHILPNCGTSNNTYDAVTEEELYCFESINNPNNAVLYISTPLFDCPGERLVLGLVDENGISIDLCNGFQFGEITAADPPDGIFPTSSGLGYIGLSINLIFNNGDPDQLVYVGLRDSENCGEGYSAFTIDLEEMQQNCIDDVIEAATNEALTIWQEDVDQIISDYYNNANNCIINAQEVFYIGYQNAEYHYTLYYYDQAADLVQTVPPIGVDLVPPGAFENGVWDGLSEPNHSQKTKYKYNSLGQVYEQYSPDGGTNRFKYDYAQRLRFSQNDKQIEEASNGDIYSYTIYDEESRIIEVGELEEATTAFNSLDEDQVNDLSFPDNTAGTFKDVTTTEYSNPSTTDGGFKQENLKGRVVLTKHEDILTRYSYDVHGNVKSLRHQIDDLGRKDIHYKYDLISGNVKEVALQPNRLDQFFHRYEYDADNRLTHVYTSEDYILWENDARYYYHIHGPMARMEVGHDKVQGMDYYYSLQGWIKGVNVPGANSWEYEPGTDGRVYGKNLNQWIARDEYAYALGYNSMDYTPIGSNVNLGAAGSDMWEDINAHVPKINNNTGLFNGNISMMITDIKTFNDTGLEGLQALSYKYDQLHRIRSARSYGTSNGADWSANGKYDSHYFYDGNGNLQKLRRFGPDGLMDQLDYSYDNSSNTNDPDHRPNRLLSVKDNPALEGVYPEDFDGHDVDDNYAYDGIGNLIKDDKELIEEIQWNVYGKVDAVIYSAAGQAEGRKNVYYEYDAAGNRLKKLIDEGVKTFYLRDASGNILSIYKFSPRSGNLTQDEVPLYGSSRLGQRMFSDRIMNVEQRPPDPRRIRGDKVYELSNHLGNVLVTISDQKIGEDANQNTIADYYNSINKSAVDYYAFGASMPGRNQESVLYRYGFNGKENSEDGEFGSQLIQDYGFRLYNPAIARFLSVDPLAAGYAWYTPYQFAGNMPIWAIDLDGAEPQIFSIILLRVVPRLSPPVVRTIKRIAPNRRNNANNPSALYLPPEYYEREVEREREHALPHAQMQSAGTSPTPDPLPEYTRSLVQIDFMKRYGGDWEDLPLSERNRILSKSVSDLDEWEYAVLRKLKESNNDFLALPTRKNTKEQYKYKLDTHIYGSTSKAAKYRNGTYLVTLEDGTFYIGKGDNIGRAKQSAKNMTDQYSKVTKLEYWVSPDQRNIRSNLILEYVLLRDKIKEVGEEGVRNKVLPDSHEGKGLYDNLSDKEKAYYDSFFIESN